MADEFDAIRAERDAHAARADALENDDQSRALLMDKARTALSLAQTFFTQLTETLIIIHANDMVGMSKNSMKSFITMWNVIYE